MFTHFFLTKCLREEGLPTAHICSLHPKGKAEDLPTVAKANNCPGKFCCFYNVCSPTCLQLCLEHSINYNCISVTKLMSNTNLALDLALRLHSYSLNSSIVCVKNNASKEVRQKEHLGSLERFLLSFQIFLSHWKMTATGKLLTKPLSPPVTRHCDTWRVGGLCVNPIQ